MTKNQETTPAPMPAHGEAARYANPPIREAVIEIRVARPDGFSIANLENVKLAIEATRKFENPQVLNELQATFSGGDPSTGPDDLRVDKESKKRGYRFASETGVVQAKTDGFVFSIPAPYSCWEDFSSQARRMWGIYRASSDPLSISRMGLRYINEIVLPSTAPELSEYFSTYPEVSKDYLFKDVSGFFQQLQIPQPDIGGILLFNLVGMGFTESSHPRILLDLDLVCEFNSKELMTDDEIWRILDTMRVRKNLIFEASITSLTRDLFQ